MLERIDHIDLAVEDVKEAVAFFKNLGFVVLREIPEPRCSAEITLPGENQVVFELKPSKDGTAHIDHIAFKAADGNAVAELKDKGIAFASENRFIKDTGRTVSNFLSHGVKWQITD